jgi:hypothetical protein
MDEKRTCSQRYGVVDNQWLANIFLESGASPAPSAQNVNDSSQSRGSRNRRGLTTSAVAWLWRDKDFPERQSRKQKGFDQKETKRFNHGFHGLTRIKKDLLSHP